MIRILLKPSTTKLLGGAAGAKLPGNLIEYEEGVEHLALPDGPDGRPIASHPFGVYPHQPGDPWRSRLFDWSHVLVFSATIIVTMTFGWKKNQTQAEWAREELMFDEWFKERDRLGLASPSREVQDEYTWAEMNYHYNLVNRPEFGSIPRHKYQEPRPNKSKWSPEITDFVTEQLLQPTGVLKILGPQAQKTGKAVKELEQLRNKFNVN